MRSLFNGWTREDALEVLSNFYNHIEKKVLPIYLLSPNKILERAHFDISNSRLKPVNYWYRPIGIDGTFGSRKKAIADKMFVTHYKKYEKLSAKLFQQKLLENNRIAIPSGSKVSDYLCARNKIALSIIRKELNSIRNVRERELVELVISSAVNLIRLSDKKASSQIPFWRPKKDITSRNALLILKDKIERCVEGLDYASSSFPSSLVEEGSKLVAKSLSSTASALILRKPFQNVSKSDIPSNSVDLILTDPPYTDQVPYLEYSQLASLILGWDNLNKENLHSEIVVSNARRRKAKNLANFNNELGKAFKQMARIIKSDGYCAIFFHDFSLGAWSNLLLSAQEASFAYQGEARIGRQRRSFKTVLTPNKTLDGNYLLIFKKRKIYPKLYAGNMEAAIASVVQNAKIVIAKNGGKASTQDLYDGGLLRNAIEDGYIHLLARKYKTFGEVLQGKLVQTNGFWTIS
jgi:hypothetical protein